jgi:hypothetical protein
MSNITRRQLLTFFTGSAVTTVFAPTIVSRLAGGANPNIANATVRPFGFTPVRVPHPLPIYQLTDSYLATAPNQGSTLPQVRAFEQMNLNRYCRQHGIRPTLPTGFGVKTIEIFRPQPTRISIE